MRSFLIKDEKVRIDIDKRSYDFALAIVKFISDLPKNVAAYELGKQLIRSGTSIAANIEEAQGAFSREDFIYKMNTALKEARETNLWLNLFSGSKIVAAEKIVLLLKESGEIKNILGKIVKNTKANNHNF